MAAAPRLKLADKQEIYKKLLAGLKKRYSAPAKLPDLPVLETMLFAVCLENATVKEADVAYKRLLASFHDLNEIRVSSVDELEVVFNGMSAPDWRASRIRGILSYVFEANYSFEFEGLKRKTLELATKQLSKIKELTPFVRDYTLHAALGAHLLPLDSAQLAVLEFLDLQAETGGPEHTAETLRPLVRKAEGNEFCGLLREFALDAKFRAGFAIVKQTPPLEGAHLPAPAVRLDKLLKGEPIKFEGGTARKPAPAPDKKGMEKKGADKKSADKKPAEPASKSARKSHAEVDKKAAGSTARSVPSKPQKPAAKPVKVAEKAKSKPAPSVAKKDAAKKPAATSKPTAKPAPKANAKPVKKQAAKSGK